MLVQCEMYEVDGQVVADIYCERCGEVTAYQVPRQVVTDLVMGNTAVICTDCQESRCKQCYRFPVPNHPYGQFVNGVCWDCRDKNFLDVMRQVALTLKER